MSEKKWHWVLVDQGGWPFVSKEMMTEAEAEATWRAQGRVVNNDDWNALQEERTHLRALVERAGELDRTYFGKDIDDLARECREALEGK